MEEKRTIIYSENFSNCEKCFEIAILDRCDDPFFDADYSIEFTDGHGERESFQLEIDELLEAFEMTSIDELFSYFKNKYNGNCLAWHFMIKELEEKGLEVDISKEESEIF